MNEIKAVTNSIIFQTNNGSLELKTDSDIETIWANLDQISQLFNRDKSVISRHIKNIFKEEELDKNSTVAFFATVQSIHPTNHILPKFKNLLTFVLKKKDNESTRSNVCRSEELVSFGRVEDSFFNWQRL
jgi:hypothetical protein